MRSTNIVVIGALLTAIGTAPVAFAAQAPPYVKTAYEQRQLAGRPSERDKSEQIDALRKRDQKIQQLIKDLQTGRPVDPNAIDRALE